MTKPMTKDQEQQSLVFLYEALDQAVREDKTDIAVSFQKEIDKIEGRVRE
jgi:hypothetical protein